MFRTDPIMKKRIGKQVSSLSFGFRKQCFANPHQPLAPSDGDTPRSPPLTRENLLTEKPRNIEILKNRESICLRLEVMFHNIISNFQHSVSWKETSWDLDLPETEKHERARLQSACHRFTVPITFHLSGFASQAKAMLLNHSLGLSHSS